MRLVFKFCSLDSVQSPKTKGEKCKFLHDIELTMILLHAREFPNRTATENVST